MESEVTVFSLRIERAKVDEFRKVAEAHHRTMAHELRHLIATAVEEYEREQKVQAA